MYISIYINTCIYISTRLYKWDKCKYVYDICTYLYVYIYRHICVYIYIYIYVHVCVCVCVCVYVYMCVCLSVHLCVCVSNKRDTRMICFWNFVYNNWWYHIYQGGQNRFKLSFLLLDIIYVYTHQYADKNMGMCIYV